MEKSNFKKTLVFWLNKLNLLIGSCIIVIIYIILEITHHTKNLNLILIILVSILLIIKIYKIYLQIKLNQTAINFLIIIATIIELYYKNYLLAIINTIIMALYPLIEEFVIFYLNNYYQKNQINYEPVNLAKSHLSSKIAPEKIKTGQKLIIKEGNFVPVDGQIIEGNSQVNFNSHTYLVKVGDRLVQGCQIIKGTVLLKASKDFSDSYQEIKNKKIHETLLSQSYLSRLMENNSLTYSFAVILSSIIVYMVTRNKLDFQRIIHASSIFYFVFLSQIDLKPLLVNLIQNNYVFKSMSKFEKFIKTKTLVLTKNGVVTDDHEVIDKINIFNKQFNQAEIIALCEKAINENTKIYQTINQHMAKNNIKKIKLKDLSFFNQSKLTKINYKNQNIFIGSIKAISEIKNFNLEELKNLKKIASPILVIANNHQLIAYISFKQKILPDFNQAIHNFKKSVKNIIILTSDHKKSTTSIFQNDKDLKIVSDYEFKDKVDYLDNLKDLPVTFIDNSLKDNLIKTKASCYLNLNHNIQPNLNQSDLALIDKNLNQISQVYLKLKQYYRNLKYLYFSILFINLFLIFISIELNLSLLLTTLTQLIFFLIIASFMTIFAIVSYHSKLPN